MNLTGVVSYDFLAPARLVFGWGRWRELGPLAAQLGQRAFLINGSKTLAASGVLEEVRALLRQHGVEVIDVANVSQEPTVTDVDQAAGRLRKHRVRAGDFVLGIGGGSALDMAKALAALATNTAGATVQDYLEGVGCGLTLDNPPLPIIAMPTTAGTGSEATKNAVISCRSPSVKKSLRGDGMLPRVVIVDPEWTVSVPPAITAHTGMDAITQLIESYISKKAKPIPQALAIPGLRLALSAIVEAVENGGSRPAREAMAHAALLSGMALANSGLGMAHGVAAALGVHNGVSHGLACATLLPIALEVNRTVCEQQLAELARFAGLAAEVPNSVAADALISRIGELCNRIGVPRRLSGLGVRREQIADLVRDSRGNSMDGNPRKLTDEELGQILGAHL